MDKETTQQFDRVHKSIDKLAVIVAEGFSAVDARFEQVDERFEQVDARFDKVDARFDKVEADIADLRIEIRSIRFELEHLPDKIDATYAGVINDLLDRVRVLERRFNITA